MRFLTVGQGEKSIGFSSYSISLSAWHWDYIDVLTGFLDPETGLGVFSGIYALGVMIPGMAVSVRRLHDTGRNGWWILINLVPLLGTLVFIYFMVLDSNPERNEYGPSPKGYEV